MLEDYRKTLSYLYSLQKFGIKFGLNRTENILSRLGNPERSLSCIHIAGTNGKGSTAAILSSILQEHGFRVGLYTSPHLIKFTERFKINGKDITPQRVVEVFEQVNQVMDPSEIPTFFEVVTAMGLFYFAQEEVDWAIIEVGMGGRLDATNVIHPKICIITNVSKEHEEYLGRTLSAISREKAGIIKENTPVVTGAQQPVVQSVLKATCLRASAPLYRLGTHFRIRRNGDGSFQYFGLRSHYRCLRLSLTGEHQYDNAALAVATLEVLEKQGLLVANEAAIRKGLGSVYWPARLEVLEHNPTIVLDGAHNPNGAEALRKALQNNFTFDRLHLVLGVMSDKDIQGIFRRLLPFADSVILTRPSYGRAADPDQLRRFARPYAKRLYVIIPPRAAIEQAKALAESNDLICIAGSLYFAGEVKALYEKR